MMPLLRPVMGDYGEGGCPDSVKVIYRYVDMDSYFTLITKQDATPIFIIFKYCLLIT